MDEVELAARGWYGYGRWDAPYWFIGPEPGMKKDEGDNLRARCEAWAALGSPELLDCLRHHEEFGFPKWHTRRIRMTKPNGTETMRPPTQNTWRRLILLLLSYKAERCDIDSVADYQRCAFGSSTGETCAVELSALAANSLATERDRESFREERCAHLRSRLLESAPEFAVMYGIAAQKWYERIAGGAFDESGYVWAGKTLCALVEHPTARPGKPAQWWIEKGAELREILSSRSATSRS
jgi:hypothetical protein